MALRTLSLAFALLLCGGSSSAERQRPGQSILRVNISAAALLASFDGQLQTPSGGRAGSTSSGRPTTSEIGLDGLEVLALMDAEFEFIGRHAVHFSYADLSQQGRDTLERRLVSQGQTIPADANVKSRLEMPLGRIGYRARWLALSYDDWSIALEVGAARIDFRYRLKSREATGPVDRAYVVYFAYWGFQLRGAIRDRLRGEIDLLASAGLSNVVSLDSDVRLLYRIAESKFVTASLLLGVRGIWLHYKDDQKEEQNDIDVRLGAFSTRPWAGVHFGLRLGY